MFVAGLIKTEYNMSERAVTGNFLQTVVGVQGGGKDKSQ